MEINIFIDESKKEFKVAWGKGTEGHQSQYRTFEWMSDALVYYLMSEAPWRNVIRQEFARRKAGSLAPSNTTPAVPADREFH